MRKCIVLLLSLFTITEFSMAQEVTIKEEMMNMKSYLFSDPNPIPEISRIYPYFSYDGFTNKSVFKNWKMVILENEYIKVFVCPQIGGKIWGAVEKLSGKEFMYFNNVVKFRQIAMRGPWTSGGMEYNFGDIGHDPNGATPVNYTMRKNDDGSVACTVSSIDLPSLTRWNVEISLEKGKAYFTTKTSWFNSTALPCTYYHWMNAAAKSSGNLEFLYPGNAQIGHGGEAGSWPVDRGRNISFYEKNNFGGYKSYHVINSFSNYFGGYWHDDDFGFGHYARFDDKPGKKIWIWGLSQQGMIWKDLLTDTDGQYVEYQSGKLFNQGAYSSTFSPFKHREFAAHDADKSTEIWFPLKGTGGMVAASEYAVLNVQKKVDGRMEIALSALQFINDNLTIYTGDTVVRAIVKLHPLQVFRIQVNVRPGQSFRVQLGENKISYSSDQKGLVVERPIEHHPEFNWNSAYGLYTLALEFDKQRMYSEAMATYQSCLEKEPAFLPALSRMALACYRKMDFDEALKYVMKSLSVDTYDPLANYLFGLIHVHKADPIKAKNGFSIASHAVEYRSSAYTELATLFLKEGNSVSAITYAEKALLFNSNNITALEILTIVARKQNNRVKAEDLLAQVRNLDATSHFATYERYKWGFTGINVVKEQIRNELPVETYLYLALHYWKYGCNEDAVEILKTAPEHPIILLWLAELDQNKKNRWLQKAIDMPIDFVFPHRSETASLLHDFIKNNNNWKLKYYLALILWNRGDLLRAKELMAVCGNDPDSFIFFLAKAKLFESDSAVVRESLTKARTLKNDDWRVNLAWINHQLGNGEYRHAEELSKEYYKRYPEKSSLGFQYAQALIGLAKFDECIRFLETLIVIPNEGATAGRNIYHEACIRAAYDALKRKDFKKAVEYGEKAKKWLVNMGVGRPYDVDERLDDFIIAYAYEKMGSAKLADDYYRKVAEYVTPEYQNDNSKLMIQVTALRKVGKTEHASDLINLALARFPENEYVKWVVAAFSHDDRADSLKNDILNTPVKVRIYDTRYIDEEFRLVTDLFRIIKIERSPREQ